MEMEKKKNEVSLALSLSRCFSPRVICLFLALLFRGRREESERVKFCLLVHEEFEIDNVEFENNSDFFFLSLLSSALRSPIQRSKKS